jgi:hypothetical protein
MTAHSEQHVKEPSTQAAPSTLVVRAATVVVRRRRTLEWD